MAATFNPYPSKKRKASFVAGLSRYGGTLAEIRDVTIVLQYPIVFRSLDRSAESQKGLQRLKRHSLE
jgi:hypothetical protein